MNALFRPLRSSLQEQDFAIKNSLIAKLSACVKDLLVDQADPNSIVKNSYQDVSALCVILEAILIHGLKGTFIQRISQAISEADARPDPNFWAPLLEVSHRDVIDEVSVLSQIQTDVGRCRAWLRLALNEGVLSRYLEAMRTEGQRTLSHYYRKGALMRDVEMLDVVQRILEGIESYPFNIPLNSSLLDVWTKEPLLLAGLWTPPMKSVPEMKVLDVATDIAQVLMEEEQEASRAETVSLVSSSSFPGNSFGPMMPRNEEEALKRILGTPVHESPFLVERYDEAPDPKYDKTSCLNVVQRETVLKTETEIINKSGDTCVIAKENETEQEKNKAVVDVDDSSGMGNSLTGRLGWSSSFEESLSDSGKSESLEENEKFRRRKVRSKKAQALQSYHSLLENYNASSSQINPPDLNSVIQTFRPTLDSNSCEFLGGNEDLSYSQELGFEVVEDLPLSSQTAATTAFRNFLSCASKLPQELGLDTQKYTCFDCGMPIGFNFGEVRLCALTGKYFCVECTVVQGDEWVIPARIIHNWDYRRYTVCKRAASFLTEVQYHPLLDLKKLNPLYLSHREVRIIQELRYQLNFLSAYLLTCKKPVILDLQKMMWSREYLYEHIHLYSINDLLELPSGSLQRHLKRVIAFARKHVYSCVLCSQKGFLCEECKDPKIIYPFETDVTFRCQHCCGVFHAECFKSKQECPKCKRIRERMNRVAISDSIEVKEPAEY